MCITAFAQDAVTTSASGADTTHTNPIIFGNFNFGAGAVGLRGFSYGVTMNYQGKFGLLTARLSAIQNYKSEAVLFFPVLFRDRDIVSETALLYGYRKIYQGSSLSFALGASYNHRTRKYIDKGESGFKSTSSYAGIPFELNFLLFNSIKRRYRLYYIIPVSKPTGFSRTIGFKVFGNVSKNSYAAVGLVYGYGFHKHY